MISIFKNLEINYDSLTQDVYTIYHVYVNYEIRALNLLVTEFSGNNWNNLSAALSNECTHVRTKTHLLDTTNNNIYNINSHLVCLKPIKETVIK